MNNLQTRPASPTRDNPALIDPEVFWIKDTDISFTLKVGRARILTPTYHTGNYSEFFSRSVLYYVLGKVECFLTKGLILKNLFERPDLYGVITSIPQSDPQYGFQWIKGADRKARLLSRTDAEIFDIAEAAIDEFISI